MADLTSNKKKKPLRRTMCHVFRFIRSSSVYHYSGYLLIQSVALNNLHLRTVFKASSMHINAHSLILQDFNSFTNNSQIRDNVQKQHPPKDLLICSSK